jgi:ketosteroid isomerase-like protein
LHGGRDEAMLARRTFGARLGSMGRSPPVAASGRAKTRCRAAMTREGRSSMDAEASKSVVRRYFDALSSGDPGLADLLAEDVRWWVPEGSDMAGEKVGRDAVLAFLGGGVDYYDASAPMEVSIRSMIAEGGRVACEFTIRATTAKGRPYQNDYHFAFEVEKGRIREVREYLDTHYAHLAFHGQDDGPDARRRPS